jgi:hypothetical protein
MDNHLRIRIVAVPCKLLDNVIHTETTSSSMNVYHIISYFVLPFDFEKKVNKY